MYSIEFTDGFMINLIPELGWPLRTTRGYSNALAMYYVEQYHGISIFGGGGTTKTDLDGNVWIVGAEGIRINFASGGTVWLYMTQYNIPCGMFFVYNSESDSIGVQMSYTQRNAYVWGFYNNYSGDAQFAPEIARVPDKQMYNILSDFSVVIYSGDLNSVGYGIHVPASHFQNSLVETPDDTDPYSQGGQSGTGGGHGTFSGTSDNIDFPSLPTLSAVDAGFITLFNPSISELNALATYMWTNPLFDIANWKKIFADPMDAILGLSIVPVNVPSGGSSTVTVGNISTGVSMTTAATQYVAVDCGSLNVQEYWGAYLDYSPYTKCEIYLPYCGTHPLSVDDIMGKSVHVRYHIDILSGACCAYVKCGNSVLYTFVGQCTSSIPITGNDWTNVVNGALSIATSIGSMVASGGVTAPLAVPSIANSANNVIKPEVEKSGSMGGTGGMLGIQTPYLILTRPNQAIPKHQNRYKGYPSYITYKLSDLSGFTVVDSIRLSKIPATDIELQEIETILKRGVIL